MQYCRLFASLQHDVVFQAVIWTEALFSIVACQSVNSQSPFGTPSFQIETILEASIEFTDDTVIAPEEIPAGIVTINYENKRTVQRLGAPLLGKLTEGKTLNDLKVALQTDDPTEALAMVTWLGGAFECTTYNLAEGEYVVRFQGPPEEAPPAMTTVTVKDKNNLSAAPQADVEVELVDFAFNLPDEIKAGKQLWKISNSGQQLHHMAIVKLAEGIIIEDVIRWYNAPGDTTLSPGFGLLAFYANISPGQSGWTEIFLPAGEYQLISFLPDYTSMASLSQLERGMTKTLQVIQPVTEASGTPCLATIEDILTDNPPTVTIEDVTDLPIRGSVEGQTMFLVSNSVTLSRYTSPDAAAEVSPDSLMEGLQEDVVIWEETSSVLGDEMFWIRYPNQEKPVAGVVRYGDRLLMLRSPAGGTGYALAEMDGFVLDYIEEHPKCAYLHPATRR